MKNVFMWLFVLVAFAFLGSRVYTHLNTVQGDPIEKVGPTAEETSGVSGTYDLTLFNRKPISGDKKWLL